MSGGGVKIKNSTQYAHDHNVSKTYDTYQGQTDSVNSTTGFADHIFYTERAMNVYYYPVLASESCPSNDPDCTTKYPTYVEFSVPDQVQHADVDGTNQDWYQPVHEPGNALSYPWSLTQLQDQFAKYRQPAEHTSVQGNRYFLWVHSEHLERHHEAEQQQRFDRFILRRPVFQLFHARGCGRR